MTEREIDDPAPPAAPARRAPVVRRPVRRRGYEASLRSGESGPVPGPPAAMTVAAVAPDPAGAAPTKSAGQATTSGTEADS
jgi:hypothetical protein